MTAYEIIMIILGILALLVSFGGLIIALLYLPFSIREIVRKKKNAYPVCQQDRRRP